MAFVKNLNKEQCQQLNLATYVFATLLGCALYHTNGFQMTFLERLHSVYCSCWHRVEQMQKISEIMR